MNKFSFFCFLHLFFNCYNTNKLEEKCWNPTSEVIGHILKEPYQVIFAKHNHIIVLNCSICGDNTSVLSDVEWGRVNYNETNVFYQPFGKKKNGIKMPEKMFITNKNSLIIQKLKNKYDGFYYCKGFNNSKLHNKFTYYLEIINETRNPLLNGRASHFKNYSTEVLEPLNLQIELEQTEDTEVNVFMFWQEWGKCLCGQSKFDSRMFRVAYCLIKIKDPNKTIIGSCHSKMIQRTYPTYFIKTMNLSNYQLYKRCTDDCVPDLLEKDSIYKYKFTYYLSQRGNLRLICPESENSSDIIWIRNEKTLLNKSNHPLGTGTEEEHVGVDSNNILYINDATNKETGLYSCLVDGVGIKLYKVIITPLSIFRRREFYESIRFLTYIMLLCFILYWFILVAKMRNAQRSIEEQMQLI